MKNVLTSSVALFGLTAAAVAADVPSRKIAPATPAVPVVSAPVFTWTGFYAGINAGYGFSNQNNNKCVNGCSFGDSGLAVPTLAADFALGPLVPVVPASGFPVGFGSLNGNRHKHDGFVGGGQTGYNYQFTPGSGVVIGIETDLQYAGFSRRRSDGFFGGFGSNTFTANPVLPAGYFTNGPGFGISPPNAGSAGNVVLFDNAFGNRFGRNRIDWFGTVRGRLGYAVDRLLIYATGGGAFTDRSDRCSDRGVFYGGFGCSVFVSGAAIPASFFIDQFAAAIGANVSATNSFFPNGHARRDNDFGWTVGGGIEYAFTDNLTAKLEGLYINFNSERRSNFSGFGGNVVGVTNTGAVVTSTGLAFGGFDNRHRDEFAVIRAGLNYKFTAF